ncbi:MAG: DMT family transporter [Myxococcales bacterium]|nr:DMT family transporter [Myxococcales bacterium]MCB9577315.1 DMT family transporter [Polyangiaceae bacterium]
MALFVAFASALSWAGFDVYRKLCVRHIDTSALVVLLSLAEVPLFGLWVALDPGARLTPEYALPASSAAVLSIVANLLYLESVRLSPLSRTIPLLSLTPAASALAAWPLLSEVPSHTQTGGIVIVVVGALLLNAGPDELRRPWRLLGAFAADRGGVYMACVALLWSLLPAVDKLSMTHASASVHGLVINAAVASGMFVIMLLRGRAGRVREVARAPRVFAGAVLFATLALGTQLLALGWVLVSLFEAVKRATGMTASLITGRLVFHEQVRIPQVAAVLLMATGVVLVVSG